MKRHVLFVCIHNSARSQMAEAFLNGICGHEFEAYSAGLEAGKLNPVVVEAMAEAGYDISQNRTKQVTEFLHGQRWFQYVIAVCDEANAEKCPTFPGISQRLNWPFPDPSVVSGTHEENLSRTREIRDLIRSRIERFCETECGAAK